MFKKIIYKIIGFSLLILFGLDSTTFLEGLDENQETENNSIQKQSWWDYICLHKFEILIGCGVVTLVLILAYFDKDTPLPPLYPPMDLDDYLINPKIDQILISIKHTITPNIFYKIIEILTDVNDPLSPLKKEEAIMICKNMIKNSVNSDLVSDPEKFVKGIKKLINEIKKF